MATSAHIISHEFGQLAYNETTSEQLNNETVKAIITADIAIKAKERQVTINEDSVNSQSTTPINPHHETAWLLIFNMVYALTSSAMYALLSMEDAEDTGLKIRNGMSSLTPNLPMAFVYFSLLINTLSLIKRNLNEATGKGKAAILLNMAFSLTVGFATIPATIGLGKTSLDDSGWFESSLMQALGVFIVAFSVINVFATRMVGTEGIIGPSLDKLVFKGHTNYQHNHQTLSLLSHAKSEHETVSSALLAYSSEQQQNRPAWQTNTLWTLRIINGMVCAPAMFLYYAKSKKGLRTFYDMIGGDETTQGIGSQLVDYASTIAHTFFYFYSGFNFLNTGYALANKLLKRYPSPESRAMLAATTIACGYLMYYSGSGMQHAADDANAYFLENIYSDLMIWVAGIFINGTGFMKFMDQQLFPPSLTEQLPGIIDQGKQTVTQALNKAKGSIAPFSQKTLICDAQSSMITALESIAQTQSMALANGINSTKARKRLEGKIDNYYAHKKDDAEAGLTCEDFLNHLGLSLQTNKASYIHIDLGINSAAISNLIAQTTTHTLYDQASDDQEHNATNRDAIISLLTEAYMNTDGFYDAFCDVLQIEPQDTPKEAITQAFTGINPETISDATPAQAKAMIENGLQKRQPIKLDEEITQHLMPGM